MRKTAINVKEVISKMDGAMDKLEQGIPNAKLSKKDAKDIAAQLEDVIALAESIKVENYKDKAKRA